MANAAVHAAANAARRTVLLVEDSAGDILLILQALADNRRDVLLKIAVDGEQALQMLSDPDFQPAFIILDLNIPKIPGNIVLERRRSAGTPIIVFSSCGDEGEIARALRLGAREYVQKPADLDAYSEVVRGMFEKWAAPA